MNSFSARTNCSRVDFIIPGSQFSPRGRPILFRLNTLIILASLIIFVVSFFNRNDLLDDMLVDPALTGEPVQEETNREPAELSVAGFDYEVNSLYDYEITGLVVSYRVHDGDHGVHRLSKDHLNVADMCIVWGENATSLPLSKFEFWNREFTCYVQSDRENWSLFNGHELSNNHLISDNPAVRDAIRDVGVGDQIRISGSLAEYRNLQSQGFRGTSTVRTDTGNGACETILVDHISIIKSYSSMWRNVMYAALITFLLSLTVYLVKPFRVAV